MKLKNIDYKNWRTWVLVPYVLLMMLLWVVVFIFAVILDGMRITVEFFDGFRVPNNFMWRESLAKWRKANEKKPNHNKQ